MSPNSNIAIIKSIRTKLIDLTIEFDKLSEVPNALENFLEQIDFCISNTEAAVDLYEQEDRYAQYLAIERLLRE